MVRMEFTADDNLKFDKIVVRFSNREENAVGRREIAHSVQFLLFPQSFQKTCTADTIIKSLFGKRSKPVVQHGSMWQS